MWPVKERACVNPRKATALFDTASARGANVQRQWQTVAHNADTAANEIKTANLSVPATAFCFYGH
jgi:hypothetical protein